AEVASQRRVAASQVVLAWLIARGTRPIIGASSVEQLDSALAAVRLDLDDETMARLDQPT
uniref:aldo/keto reductase n=1 Tax=Nocardioides sp. TaxID=35761 RepID=UPI00286E38F4